MILPLLIFVSPGYAVFGVSKIVSERRGSVSLVADEPHHASKFVFTGGEPLRVTGAMTYLFSIVIGAAIFQFSVGSESCPRDSLNFSQQPKPSYEPSTEK